MKTRIRILPEIQKFVTQEQIAAYAEASGDLNPIHLDPIFASKTTFGQPIAHGMLILAFVSEMMTVAFGQDWIENGHLKARFRSAVYPGDALTIYGAMVPENAVRDDCSTKYSIECINQRGVIIITATATI